MQDVCNREDFVNLLCTINPEDGDWRSPKWREANEAIAPVVAGRVPQYREEAKRQYTHPRSIGVTVAQRVREDVRQLRREWLAANG